MNNLSNAGEFMKSWGGHETIEDFQQWIATCRPELVTECIAAAMDWGAHNHHYNLSISNYCLDAALQVMDPASMREYHKFVGMMPHKERPEFPIYIDSQGNEHAEF